MGSFLFFWRAKGRRVIRSEDARLDLQVATGKPRSSHLVWVEPGSSSLIGEKVQLQAFTSLEFASHDTLDKKAPRRVLSSSPTALL